jgi:hypothetical protein
MKNMKSKLAIVILLAATTLGASAYARGDDRDWEEHRHEHWRHHRHEDWRYDHRHDNWRRDERRPPYAHSYDAPPPPRHYEQPAVILPLPPLPPPPHEVLRDLLHGHR